MKEDRVYLPQYDVTIIGRPNPATLRPKNARRLMSNLEIRDQLRYGEILLIDSEGEWAIQGKMIEDMDETDITP